FSASHLRVSARSFRCSDRVAMNQFEARVHSRVSMIRNAEICVVGEKTWRSVTVLETSRGGAWFTLDSPIQRNERLWFRIPVSDTGRERIGFMARVGRLRKDDFMLTAEIAFT